MSQLLYDLNEITQEEIELAALIDEETSKHLNYALEVRTALKVRTHEAGIYLSDSSLDSLTAALLTF